MPNPLRAMQKEETVAVTSLGRLIARMALDEVLHRAYLDDPEGVIARAGLSDDEASALRVGDWNAILSLLGPKDRDPKLDAGDD